MDSLAEALQRAVQSQQSGNLAAAEQLCRQILQANPSQANALHLLGVIGCQTGRHELGVKAIRAALAQQPTNPVYFNNLGIACQELGKLTEAVAHYEQAIRYRPNFPEAHQNLGTALLDLGRLDEAAACLRHALRLRPDFAEAHCGLGNVLKAQNQADAALESYRLALHFNPKLADAHNNLGNHLRTLGRLDEAVASCQQAIRLRPNYAPAFNNLAIALANQGQLKAALASYREALRLQPNFPLAHSNLLFGLVYDPEIEAETLFAEHCRWEAVHGQKSGSAHANSRDPDRPLRVGYVSPDLRAHPVARFLEPILSHHDPTQVEAWCYAELPMGDAMTARLQTRVKGWRTISGQNPTQAAEQIRKDGIDILVDLAGHTSSHCLRIFAQKPAPIQVTYLGYPHSTGLKTMDYFLTDAVADPPEQPSLASEELVRLPGGFCCYRPPDYVPEVSPPPVDQTGRITFGSFHKLPKLNPTVLDLWSAILRKLPSARLLLFREVLIGATREMLFRQFAERGIDGDQLDLRAAAAPGQSHWNIYGEVDISLDPFPWSGHTIACESLTMGVPVVTLRGNRYSGRLVASVLTRLGLTDWIANTPEEYVTLAVAKANDREGLRSLRATLRESMKANLGDGQRFTRELETAYRSMWRRWCAT